MRILKTALFVIAGVFVASVAEAATPIRYVQISTNTLSRQSGTEVVQGVDTSTLTVRSSATISNLTVQNTLTFGDGTSQTTSALASGTTFFIRSQNTLQAGATFYVSSGTVASQLQVATLKFGDGTTMTSASGVNFSSRAVVSQQSVTSTSYAPFSNIASTFTANTNGTYVQVTFSGVITQSAANCGYSLFRGSKNLSTGTDMCENGTSTTAIPCTMQIIDGPLTSGSTVYFVGAFESGGATCRVNSGSVISVLGL